MAGTLRFGWGPEVNHIETYVAATPIPAGYSIVAAPAPPAASYAFRAVNVSVTAPIGRGPAADTFAAQNYTWGIFSFRADGTFTGSDKFCIFRWNNFSGSSPFNAIGLRALGQGDGSYKVALVDNSGNTNASSTSTYASTADITGRIEYDGTNCRVWINGTLEITYATSNKPTSAVIILWYLGSDMATVTKYWSSYALKTSASGADRPGTTLGSHRLDPNANTGETDYGDDVDCTDQSLGDWDNWNGYAGGGTPPSGAPHNCATASNWQEVSSLTTVATSDTIEAAIAHYWLRANVASKTVTNWARLKQSGSASEVALDNLGSTDWSGQSAVFAVAPGGGAWDIPNLELGHRVVSGNGASAEVSAIAAEIITLNSDPPTAVPRTFGTVIG